MLRITLFAPDIVEKIPDGAPAAETSGRAIPKVTSTRLAGTTRRHARELARLARPWVPTLDSVMLARVRDKFAWIRI